MKTNLLNLAIVMIIFSSPLMSQIRIDNTGNTILRFGTFSPGNDAILYMGDYNHYIKSKFGYGVSIGTNGSEEAIKIPQFSGKVGIFKEPSYTLDVNGRIRSTNSLIISDKRLKTKIMPCYDKVSLLKNLYGVSYFFKQLEKDTIKENNQQMQYGFIAQELQKVFPELVYADLQGYLSVDYISFIPLLVEALNDQAKEIEQLKSAINSFNTNISNNINSTTACIYQNNPNPFHSDTEIKYYIPENSSQATIIFYDLQGVQKKVVTALQKGNSSIVIKGDEFKAGMYLYSLIVDNILIDTKRMILTD